MLSLFWSLVIAFVGAIPLLFSIAGLCVICRSLSDRISRLEQNVSEVHQATLTASAAANGADRLANRALELVGQLREETRTIKLQGDNE